MSAAPPPAGAAANAAHAFCRALLEELARSGLRHVCVCPGSRSTPLALAALAQPGLRAWSHIDERSAAYFALGLSKAAREPVALICTSGTAAANFHPAVIEAHYARVPLLVLTADRPPEQREWGAGQTVDQLRLYGRHTRWSAELAPPEAGDAALRHARALACRAWAEACGPLPGPVHLNLPFREPLEPGPGEGAARESAARSAGAYTRARAALPAPGAAQVERLAELALGYERGIVACGPVDAPPELAWAVARLAAAAGWPVLADPTSQLRCGPHVRGAPILATSDLFLREPDFARARRPDCVLRIGATPTSRAFRTWSERHRPAHFLCAGPEAAWQDPGHLASEVFAVDAAALCDAAAARVEAARGAPPASDWLQAFLAAEEASAAAVEQLLAEESALLEPRAAREVAEAVPEDGILYVSNSMPVRDLDAFLPRSERPLRVLCNRGANGIDGVPSSALGAAAAGRGRVVLLTGDLAFLHDLSGLLAARRHGLPVSLVVLNNDGGGIFSFLPIAQHGEAVGFEEYYRTPHGLELGPVAASLGAGFARASCWEHLRAALKESLASPRANVVEVPVDRDRNVAHHREIQAAVGAALAARRLW